MKIIFFINSLSSGGAERVTSNLANYWAAIGYQVKIVTLLQAGSDFYALSDGVERLSLPTPDSKVLRESKFLSNIWRIRKIRAVLKAEKPDVAISMMTKSNVYLALSSVGISGVTTIGSERNYPPKRSTNRIWMFLRKYAYNRLSCVVAPTEKTKQWLEKNTKVKRVEVIPNSVSHPIERSNPIVSTPIRGQRNVLLAVGRLVIEKDYETLINVFAGLSRKHTSWDLHILGDGPMRNNLRALVESFCLERRVFFHGVVGNVGDWYCASDLYVLTSKTEGFPNTLVEAMSYGLPAVSYDCETGPSDIIDNGVNGILVDDRDIEKLSVALDNLMSDEAMRSLLGEKAKFVGSRFSPNVILKKWEELLVCCEAAQ